MPLFLLSSGGLAIALIMLCINFCEQWPGHAWDWLANAGQMAISWYLAHIFVVIGVGIACGFRGDVSLPTAYIVAGCFFFIMCASSVIYRRFLKFGPLELMMRKLTG
ncbi:MAG: hypothetical protein ACI814_004231 [Mariniblastus sp.]|jgi:uncharacterized protein